MEAAVGIGVILAKFFADQTVFGIPLLRGFLSLNEHSVSRTMLRMLHNPWLFAQGLSHHIWVRIRVLKEIKRIFSINLLCRFRLFAR